MREITWCEELDGAWRGTENCPDNVKHKAGESPQDKMKDMIQGVRGRAAVPERV